MIGETFGEVPGPKRPTVSEPRPPKIPIFGRPKKCQILKFDAFLGVAPN